MPVAATTTPSYPAPATVDTVTAAAAVRLSNLPDDNIVEILARVSDAVSLFRCTVVCNRWRGIISHPAFLRRRFGSLSPAGGGESSLLGFFVQRHLLSTTARGKVLRNTPSWAPIFVPASGSALGPTRRFLTYFVVPGDGDDTRMFDDAKPLAVRDGLLLLRILPKFRENKAVLRLCVCDLLTGKHDLLPPIYDIAILGGDGAIGYAVLRSAAAAGHTPPANGYSTLFRVLIVGVHHQDHRLYIGEVSSDAPAPGESVWDWRSTVTGDLEDGGVLLGCRRAAAVVTGGAANWLLHAGGNGQNHLHTLGVSIDTGRAYRSTFSLSMPVDYFSPWLCREEEDGVDNGDGNFSLLLACDRHLLILTNQCANEDGSVSWSWCRTRSFHGSGGVCDMGLSGMEPVCVAEKSGVMLVLYRSDPDHAYLIDIRSGSSTAMVAAGKRSLNYASAVPCEINLLEFFKARLGVQAAAAEQQDPGGSSQPTGLNGEDCH